MNSELHNRPLPSRRRFVLALPLLGAAAQLASPSWAGVAASSATPSGQVHASRVLMGTRVDITVAVSENRVRDAREAAHAAFEHMEKLEAMMSRYNKNSNIARIERAAGQHPVPIAPEVMAVLQTAKRLHSSSAGAFDVTVGALRGWNFTPGQESAPTPAQIKQALALVNMKDLVLNERASTAYLARPGMALDLGGVAKLPILEAGINVLTKAGIPNALINGGGDVLTRGLLHHQPWRIGVRDPGNPTHLLGVLELEGTRVLASSGDYERYFLSGQHRLHHVLNPHTGWPTEGTRGVALLASNVDDVNGWGTALMVHGLAHADAWHTQYPNTEGLLVASNGRRWISHGMAQLLRSTPS